MRGFPLLNVVLVVTFFVLAWWPLQKAVGDRVSAVEGHLEVGSSLAEGGYTLEVTSSHPLVSFQLSHLDAPLLVVDAPGEAMEELEFGRELEGVKVPAEGIELWVEASFAGTATDDQRPVLRLEIVPDDVERELGAVTLWGELGGKGIDAPAAFLWTTNPDGA